jgi:hypothetical protein
VSSQLDPARLLYPALLVLALAAWGAIGFDLVAVKGAPAPVHVIIQQAPR